MLPSGNLHHPLAIPELFRIQPLHLYRQSHLVVTRTLSSCPRLPKVVRAPAPHVPLRVDRERVVAPRRDRHSLAGPRPEDDFLWNRPVDLAPLYHAPAQLRRVPGAPCVDVPVRRQHEDVVRPRSDGDGFLCVAGFVRQCEDGRGECLVSLVGGEAEETLVRLAVGSRGQARGGA